MTPTTPKTPRPADPVGGPTPTARAPAAPSHNDTPLESLGKAIIAPVLDAGDNDPDAPPQRHPTQVDPGR